MATPYTGKNPIDTRDFWYICGRAGRAFVDGEGKILYSIDDTRSSWQIKNDEALARSYFDAHVGDRVESGLLFVVSELRRIADRAGVGFDVLLEAAVNNDFSRLGGEAETCEVICDLIDDELLALHTDPVINSSGSGPEVWVERVFRESLAVLQARWGRSATGEEDVLAFLRARANSSVQRVSEPARRAVVSSGLPLRVALRAEESLHAFARIADSYDAERPGLPELATAVRMI